MPLTIRCHFWVKVKAASCVACISWNEKILELLVVKHTWIFKVILGKVHSFRSHRVKTWYTILLCYTAIKCNFLL